jgi:SpoVK/Ycf46/Vps4 family AAA+-type ATPase
MVRGCFKLARSTSPCILFFDEIDAIVGAEGNDANHGMNRSTMSSAESRVLSTFLNEMDGVDGSSGDGVIVLAATNRPWTLDKALLRSGRFDHAIYVPPPDHDGRLSIFKMFCGAQIAGEDLERLASDEVSGSMTGAEIVGACRAAAVTALKRAIHTGDDTIQVTLEDLRESLSATQPLLSKPDYFKAFLEFESNRLRS